MPSICLSIPSRVSSFILSTLSIKIFVSTSFPEGIGQISYWSPPVGFSSNTSVRLGRPHWLGCQSLRSIWSNGFRISKSSKSLPECLATSTVPLRSILRTMIFCPFRCLLDLLGWLSSESYGCMYRDWWCIVEGWYPSLIIPFDLCIWWRWSSWYYLWIIPWSELWSFFLWPLFSVPFFHGAVVCFLLPNIIGLLALLHLAFIQLPSFSCNFLYLFLIYFPRWILTIFADLFGCVKLCPIQLKFFASNIRAQN